MVDRLQLAVNVGAYQKQRGSIVSTARDLALKNMIDAGFYHTSMLLLVDMFGVYNQRLTELKDQEKQFWSVPNRAPNYYARTIALRLARLYAKEKGQKPTFGIARAGNHPSTNYGRALEEVFSILNIKAAVRNAADWAIGELTDSDINPPVNALAGGILAGALNYPVTSERNALAEMASVITKGSK